MPGLIRGMARTAAVVGTAGAVSHHQQQKWANQDAANQPAPEPQVVYAAPAAAPQDDLTAQLTQLASLKDQGILTQEEFDAKKKQLLGI